VRAVVATATRQRFVYDDSRKSRYVAVAPLSDSRLRNDLKLHLTYSISQNFTTLMSRSQATWSYCQSNQSICQRRSQEFDLGGYSLCAHLSLNARLKLQNVLFIAQLTVFLVK